MELSVQAPPVVSWLRDHHPLWAGRTRLSSSQLGMLARKAEVHSSIRCSASENGGEPIQEKQASEAAAAKPANGLDSGSWMQGQGNSDPFFGWTSDGSRQSNANSITGWMKLGGVTVLALGFALGARSLYMKRDVAKEFSVTPPQTEQVAARPFSEAKDVSEMSGNVDLKESNEVSESSAEGSQEATEQVNGEKANEVHVDGEGAQVLNSQNTESEGQKVDSSMSDSSATVFVSEKSGDEGGVSEASTADEGKPAVAAVIHTSTTPEENLSPGSIESADEAVSPLSPSTDGHNIVDESDMSTKFSGEEPTLDESLLEGTNIIQDIQESTPLGHAENLEREGDFKKPASQQDEWAGGKQSLNFFASVEVNKGFLPATITAPCIPADSLPSSFGEVVVPAQVDHVQEQILAALQALKVIDADVKPGDICTRREYARWLMAASAVLRRSPAHKVIPAMYIENLSILAYDDVTPQDRDFPFIQGLAEAGLLSSRLVDEEHHGLKEKRASVFSPDSPLTRLDLVTWKIALERKPAVMDGTPTSTGLMALQDKFGFIDLDKVQEDAWPALLVDISAGEQSITALTFGYTRRLQPQKPVTKGQAAVALATGEAWELVSEELARLEAESVAEAAVVAELAFEAKAQKEVAAAVEKLVQEEREKQQASASMLESTRAELEQTKALHESEKFGLLKERAALDAEKEHLTTARLEMEQQALALSNAKLEVAFQRELADKFRAEAEEERALISKVRAELEVEKNALILARSWAEDEAKKAQEHARTLEQSRNRSESQDSGVNAEKELDAVDEKVNSFGPGWQYNERTEGQEMPVNGVAEEANEKVDDQSQGSPLGVLIERTRELGQVLVDAFLRLFHFLQLMFHAIQKHTADLFERAGGRFHEATIKCVDKTTKAVEDLKRTVPSSVAGLTSSLREGTLKAVDEWKEGAEKLSQKFKTP